MWTIFASYPLGDGYWTRHTVSDPESGECFDLMERHKVAAGIPVFVCLEESCESDWCQHIRDGSTLVTMSRAGEGEGCSNGAGTDSEREGSRRRLVSSSEICSERGEDSSGSTAPPRAKRSKAPPKARNPRKFKKDRLKLWAAAEANLPEFLKAKDVEIAAWVEEIQRED